MPETEPTQSNAAKSTAKKAAAMSSPQGAVAISADELLEAIGRGVKRASQSPQNVANRVGLPSLPAALVIVVGGLLVYAAWKNLLPSKTGTLSVAQLMNNMLTSVGGPSPQTTAQTIAGASNPVIGGPQSEAPSGGAPSSGGLPPQAVGKVPAQQGIVPGAVYDGKPVSTYWAPGATRNDDGSYNNPDGSIYFAPDDPKRQAFGIVGVETRT